MTVYLNFGQSLYLSSSDFVPKAQFHSLMKHTVTYPPQVLHASKQKTGFIGFLAAIKSVQGTFQDLIALPSAPLKCLLTYKLSQDHLELFFSAVRAAGGFNNPTAQQFMAAYKRLLFRSTIKGGQQYHS